MGVEDVGPHLRQRAPQRSASSQQTHRGNAAAGCEARERLDGDRLGQARLNHPVLRHQQRDAVAAAGQEAHPQPHVDAVGVAQEGELEPILGSCAARRAVAHAVLLDISVEKRR